MENPENPIINQLEKVTDQMCRNLIEKMQKPKKYILNGQIEIHSPESGEGDGLDILEALRDGKAVALRPNDLIMVMFHFGMFQVPFTLLECTVEDLTTYLYVIDGKDDMQKCIDHYKKVLSEEKIMS